MITDAEVLRKYLFEIGYASNMSVGEYDIPYGSTNEEIARILQESYLPRRQIAGEFASLYYCLPKYCFWHF